MDPDPDRRLDLPTFLGQLREARWQALADQILARIPDAPCAVKLQAAIAVAPADQPTAFRPLRRNGRLVPAATGDFVKVEAQASADGYLTILVLEASGELGVGLPCPTEPQNHFRAGQSCHLVFRLTPPAGTERVLVHWAAKDVRRTPQAWRRWLERAGLGPEEAELGDPLVPVRGAEVVRVKKGPTPQGDCRVLVIPVPHVAVVRSSLND
jgi:hypothetical protein